MLTIRTHAALISITVACSPTFAQDNQDLNAEIIKTVEWLAHNKSGLGYDLHSRYTENLRYGDYVFQSINGPKTMCVAAVFEIFIRTLNSVKDPTTGMPVSAKLLPGYLINGSSALNLAPYILQYKSKAVFPEYKRKYSAGSGDAFVLFGLGRYVTFNIAKPGDFVYLNRNSDNGGGGHAVIFINYLDSTGRPVQKSDNARGFRYFSAQEGGTKGMGYRDAFFGECPTKKTVYKADCGVIKSNERKMFSVSRLLAPTEWFVSYSAIRVDRFFKGESIDTIVADEAAFRKRAKTELSEANRKAEAAAKKGLFPLIVPPIASEEKYARQVVSKLEFDEEEFGPKFDE